jgi:hypothetical protein
MLNAARASVARATAPPSTRHPPIDGTAIRNARSAPENNALNFSNQLKNARFGARFTPRNSPVTTQESAIANSDPHGPQFLIATQILDIELARAQQTRKHFLIATISGLSSPAPHRNLPLRLALTATHPNSENCQSHENTRETIL